MGKLSASSQDYLEAILELSLQDDKVRSVDIAQKLNVSRASVNKAIGVLKQAGYIMQERYSDIYLYRERKTGCSGRKGTTHCLEEFLGKFARSQRTYGGEKCVQNGAQRQRRNS